MKIDVKAVRKLLQEFDFPAVFAEHLGWSRPPSGMQRWQPFQAGGRAYERRAVAELGGVLVFEVRAEEAQLPDARARMEVHKEIRKLHHELLVIFLDAAAGSKGRPTQSLWLWVKHEGGRSAPRSHLYVAGQPGDLFLSKLSAMQFDLGDLDEDGNAPVVEVARRLRQALDVERVTKRFYEEFQQQHDAFVLDIEGIADERLRRWYASVLLNRLMFVWFLQKKGFVDGRTDYLVEALGASMNRGRDRFFRDFLLPLFFDGFAKPESERTAAQKKLFGDIRYLDGGLFLPHRIEAQHPSIRIPDRAFESLFALFGRYSWNLDDTPGGKDDEINPDILGYIFEKYINQKAFGAYYTRPEITEYLCERTIHRLVLDGVNASLPPARGRRRAGGYGDMEELLADLDENLCHVLIRRVLPELTVLDPACGSGAFLVAAMKTLINLYAAVIGRIKLQKSGELRAEVGDWEKNHPSLSYFVKKTIITKNLYGVDLMEEATEIAKLRLFLALVASAETANQLEPLPNIDFNILPGNGLIGLLRVDEKAYEARSRQGDLFKKTYRQIVEEKNRLVRSYRDSSRYNPDLRALRDEIEKVQRDAQAGLNRLLLDEFVELGIKYEEATWDEKKNEEGKPKKRALTLADIEALRPFHWGFEFDDILNRRGGFDAIITNPPWEVLQADEKEFFQEFFPEIEKKKIPIENWKKQFRQYMGDEEIREKWLAYISSLAHRTAYFKKSAHYSRQRTGSKTDLYALFVERVYELQGSSSLCGMVVPGGFYSDLSTSGLRQLLFDAARIESIIGISNEKKLFEGVDHRQKFCLLVYQKGGKTEHFRAAFRINPREAIGAEHVREFLRARDEHLDIWTEIVRKLAPESLSVMEFKTPIDLSIADKVAGLPRVEGVDSASRLKLATEFNMTTDSGLFKTSKSGRLPLVEGKMLHQFDHRWAEPKYWIDEKEAREVLLSARLRGINAMLKRAKVEATVKPADITLDYESFRLAFRDVARNTDERTFIAAILPPQVFCPHTVSLEQVFTDEIRDGEFVPNIRLLDVNYRFYLLALFNSFVVDFLIRQRVTAHVSFFFVYNLPIPRFADRNRPRPMLQRIVRNAARLTCTTPEFDPLAREVGLEGSAPLVDDERARLRAELDGLIAHIYGLTEEEFAHVLSTFPVVSDVVKLAARNAYRDVERGIIQ